MQAYRLPDGRLVIPERADSDYGVVGDGYSIATATEAKQWAPWTVPAPTDVIKASPNAR